MTDRTVWMTDRYGAQIDDVDLHRLTGLLDTIAVDDGDEEHPAVSLTDSDSWNLEFRADRVLFENVEDDEVGWLRGIGREEQLAIASQFLEGDLDGLRARAWA